MPYGVSSCVSKMCTLLSLAEEIPRRQNGRPSPKLPPTRRHRRPCPRAQRGEGGGGDKLAGGELALAGAAGENELAGGEVALALAGTERVCERVQVRMAQVLGVGAENILAMIVKSHSHSLGILFLKIFTTSAAAVAWGKE